MRKHIILFLAANPLGTGRLALDEEARAIQLELEGCGHRDQFEVITRWAVRPLDLLRELRKLKPTVVHFSGHSCHKPDKLRPGETPRRDGLFFQGLDGRPQLVSTAALEETFGAAGSSVKVIVLNACYSEVQARALLAHVDCIVGMRGAISDDAARNFAIGFYGGLGERESVASAYKQGRAAISLEGLRDSERPKLKVRRGVDANQLVFALPIPVKPSDLDDTLLSFRLESLDSNLQDVLALAAAQARRENKLRISTRHVFAAFVRLQPGRLSQLVRRVERISREALPEPIKMAAVPNKELLREPFFVSSCIQDSLQQLIPKTSIKKKLSSEDMFVDIARYGTGESVRRLREHGISRKSIDEIVDSLGWQIVERSEGPSE